MPKPSDSIWWFRLEVDFKNSGNVINGKKFYACKNGCLIIHADGKTIQFIANSFLE